MNVLLITHNDLDAGGCAVLTKMAFQNVDIHYCHYKNVDERIQKLIFSNKIFEYDKVYITDISVNNETADLIDNLLSEKVVLIDHHNSEKERLKKYNWAIVETFHLDIMGSNELKASSATTLLYNYFLLHNLLNIQYKEVLKEFVEHVRLFDTWEWEALDYDKPKNINNLFYLRGKEWFLDRFTKNHSIIFDETEQLLIDIEEEKFKNYYLAKCKQIFEMRFENYAVGVVFADQYVSELGNKLAKKYPNLDFIALVDMAHSKISLRGVKKDKIDLGSFAKKFGGGGHPSASSFNFDINLTQEFMNKTLQL